MSYSEYEYVGPELFYMSALTEGMSIYYTSPEETNLFHPEDGQYGVSTIKIQMFFFSVANNVVTV